MSFEILNAGPLSTVQDLGRFGVMKNGFTQSGVMDSRAAKLANLLVNNDVNCALIEMTLMGITAKFDGEYIIAVSGGDFGASINNEPIKNNKAYKVKNGDVLKIGSAKSGSRAYLAVSGGIDVPEVMNSRSTNLKSAIGGYHGRRLMNGDVVKVLDRDIYDKVYTNEMFRYARLEPDKYDSDITVRAVLGPQNNMFTQEDINTFFSTEYKVTPQSDRMGIRLDGAPLKSKNGVDIISDGIVFGSVQVPKNGMPIVLMADHQTTGGYAKIATVISVDLPLLAQVRPNDAVHFEQISVREAEKLAKKEKRFFDKLRLY
ncbi:MAG: biotin-dependent carboxyltransferase family protein [Eubacterium sp.]